MDRRRAAGDRRDELVPGLHTVRPEYLSDETKLSTIAGCQENGAGGAIFFVLVPR